MLESGTNTSHVPTELTDLSKADAELEELNHKMALAVLPVTILIGIEDVVGFFGNVLILLVCSLRYETSNFRCFILWLAVIDLTSCLTTLPGEIFSQMNWYAYQHGWICKVKSYFNISTAWGSASILSLLSYDRYKKICHPLTEQMQPNSAFKLCAASAVVSSFVALPVTILWGKQDYIYTEKNTTIQVSICEKSNAYADEIYPLVYIACVYIGPVGCMIVLIFTLNLLTVRSLVKTGSRVIHRSMRKSFSLSTFRKKIHKLSLNQTRKTFLTTEILCRNNTDGDSAHSDTTLTGDISICRNNTKSKDCSGRSSLRRNADLSLRISSIELNDNVMTPEKGTDVHTDIDTQSSLTATLSVSFSTDMESQKSESSDSLRLSSTFSGSLGSVSSQHRSSSISDFQGFRRKTKTLIMLILTSVFVTTMLLYIILLSIIAGTEGVLKHLNNSEKTIFFFFWRLYFINCVINPILYGFMDPRFRLGLISILKRNRS